MKLVAGAAIIYTSTDGGAIWTAHSGASDPSDYWYSFASSADGTTLIATGSSEHYISKNSGASWTMITPLFPSPYKQAGAGTGRAAAVSSDGTRLIISYSYWYVYISLDGGTTWSRRSSAGGWTAFAVAAQGIFSTGAFSCSLTTLDCETTYHAAAYAINASGTSYGDDVTFTTSACPTATYIPSSIPVGTDLATHMDDEINTRIAGFATTGTFKSLYTTLGTIAGGFVRNPTVWTTRGTSPLDFTGLQRRDISVHVRRNAYQSAPYHRCIPCLFWCW